MTKRSTTWVREFKFKNAFVEGIQCSVNIKLLETVKKDKHNNLELIPNALGTMRIYLTASQSIMTNIHRICGALFILS